MRRADLERWLAEHEETTLEDLSYDVKIWELEPAWERGKVVSYRVSWTVAGKLWRKTFETKARPTRTGPR